MIWCLEFRRVLFRSRYPRSFGAGVVDHAVPGYRDQPRDARHEPARRRPARRARPPPEGRDMSHLLEIDNLTVQFRGDSGWITAVDDVSLNLNEGETRGIVGEP